MPAAGSVLVPARVEAPSRGPGSAGIDNQFWCVFNSWWAAGWSARLGYHRSDLNAGYATWIQSGWQSPAYDGVRVRGVGRVAWERMVPFELDSENRVRLIAGVRFVNGTGERREIRVPQTAAMAERGEIGERWFEFGEQGR